jgi:hypothetical protein
MSKNNRPWHGSSLSFIDMLWNLLLAFTMLFALSFLQIAVNNEAKKMPELKAEYIVQLDWNDYSPADMDLWLKSPGDSIGYMHPSNGWVTLDRDDRGINNFVPVPGQEAEILPLRREVISIKKKVPGRYIIDVMFYRMNHSGDPLAEKNTVVPVPCRVQLIQVNPFKVIYSRDFKMGTEGEEVTAFSYVVNDKGEVVDISTANEPFAREFFESKG